MKTIGRPAGYYYRLLVAVAGLVLLLLFSFSFSVENVIVGAFLVVTFFIAFLAHFPLVFFQREFYLVFIITIGSGLLYGPVPAAWATLLGMIGGKLLYQWRRRSRAESLSSIPPIDWLTLLFQIGAQVIPLMVILNITGWKTGLALGNAHQERVWAFIAIAVILFIVVHAVIHLGEVTIRAGFRHTRFRRNLFSFLVVEFLPVLFVILVVDGFFAIGASALLLLGGVPAIIAVLMDSMSLTQLDLERRVQELSTLNHVSRTLRSTLDLQALLTEIHLQVTSLLGVDSFYVALYDKAQNELWYPLAVKFGERQDWQRRAITDRLTDRVILEQRPILLTHDTATPVGLPPSEETPTSWLGVPLISQEQAIGCLGVFDVDEQIIFTQADQDLLSILSGQVSVAIENALLYEQAQERAGQLETLNRLTGTLTASLDPQQVLEQVCAAVSLVSGAHQSAVFLLDAGDDVVYLAYAQGVPEGFRIRNQTFSITSSRRTRCLRTARPVYVNDVSQSSLALDLLQLFQADDIQAFADFPLITPDGQIGFLSVYYNQPHEFQRAEIELLQTLASQAAMAVSNARLHARTDQVSERRAHQLAILEAVGRDLSAATQTDRLFDLILDHALEYTNSDCGAVGIYERAKDEIIIKASQGYQVSKRIFPAAEGLSGQALATRSIVNIGDVSQMESFLDVRGGVTRSQLSVPLIQENQVLGIITLESSESHAFSAADQAFVTQLANQAAIAFVNAELYRETQRRLREQSTLYLVSAHLVGAVQLDEVVGILKQAMNAALQTQATGVYLYDEGGGDYTLVEMQPDSPEQVHLQPQISFESLPETQEGLVTGSVIFLDGSDDRRERLFPRCQDCQILIFPLLAARQCLGMIVLHLSLDVSIDHDELTLLKTVAAQGGIAVQNARLYSDAHIGRERLAAVINSVGEGILMLDVNGRILVVNEQLQKFIQIPGEQLRNRDLEELPEVNLQLLGFQRTEVKELLAELGSDQAPLTPQHTYKVGTGTTERVLERLQTPVWGQGGRLIGWMIVLRDVTDEYEISQARETITQTLVHDLRSPMSAVIGALDFISDSLTIESENDVIQQSLHVAQRSSNRVLSLIESLLDIARLQSGHMEMNLERANLGELVAGVLRDFKPNANEYGIILRSQIAQDLPDVLIDRDKIERVLVNLLDNAIKFTPEGGQVVVVAAPATERLVEIQVRDSGPGIPEEYREKIFDRFAQIPGLRGRRRGSGLGLTFCRLAVEAHGGRISVHAAPEGGSQFAFTIPTTSPIARASA